MISAIPEAHRYKGPIQRQARAKTQDPPRKITKAKKG
jgi:hypothetical protein